MSDIVEELREKVATSCRIIGTQGVTRGSFGHVSARIPGTDRILIKAKGPDQEALEFANPDDIITIDLDGHVLEGRDGLSAPNEAAMHLAAYRARPEVMSVIHAHPDWVVVLTACDLPLLPIYGGYDPQAMRTCVDGIPVYPSSVTIIDAELGEKFMSFLGDKDVCLLRGHGMTAVGRSVEESTNRSLSMYELARLNYLAYSVGTPRPIPQTDIDEFLNRRREGRGHQRPEGGAPEPSSWKYQRKLLERKGL